MDELLEKYEVFINEPTCVKIADKHKVALWDVKTVLIMFGRKVMYERTFNEPKSAKKMFIKKVKELL